MITEQRGSRSDGVASVPICTVTAAAADTNVFTNAAAESATAAHASSAGIGSAYPLVHDGQDACVVSDEMGRFEPRVPTAPPHHRGKSPRVQGGKPTAGAEGTNCRLEWRSTQEL